MTIRVYGNIICHEGCPALGQPSLRISRQQHATRMKPGCRAGQTYRARTYGHASHKHLLTKTRHLFNTSFSLVLYRERLVRHTHTGMAEARKSPFRNPYERTDHAEEAVQRRRKGSSTSRKRLFGGAEEALRQNGTLSPVMRENAITLAVSALCNTLKNTYRSTESRISENRRNFWLSRRPVF